ncbi:F-box/kelch-repeat protein [Raphanus sativus]|nr:F-box/kelch-repeat protein [Raphanus sativus]
MVMTTDLPFDLENKILARVPKKSPSQWQTVCKRWYTLRQDLLAQKHLAQAGREFNLLLNTSVFSTVIDLQEIHHSLDDPSMEFGGKLGSLQDSDDLKIHDIFYCKGLILCTMVGNQTLVVCNPCNGETRYVEPRTSYHQNDLYALGYKGGKSSCINSYKILRYCRYCNMQLRCTVSEFELYDFISDSWRVLDVDKHDWDISARGVSVKGNTYWVAKKKDDQFILSFDFTRERFGFLPLPYESADPGDFVNYEHEDTAVLSVVRDEQLSVLHQYLHIDSFEMKIWVSNQINTKKVSWSEFLVVDVVLLNVVSFVLDEEHKVAVCCSTDKDDSEEECTNISIIGENIQ